MFVFKSARLNCHRLCFPQGFLGPWHKGLRSVIEDMIFDELQYDINYLEPGTMKLKLMLLYLSVALNPLILEALQA